jgi:23S rRNA (guanosine2251-2'-O)-methyltransferase
MREIVAVLHDIRSIHNVGSIFRTADSAGIKKIYLCGITPSPFDRFDKVRQEFAKVALGAEQFVEWEKVTSITKVITQLAKTGFTVAAVELSDRSVPYTALRKTKGNIALIMGNEVKGIPARILKACNVIIEIPMRGKKESLNVSVAFGVVAYGIQY